MRVAQEGALGTPDCPQVPHTSFSAAVSSMKREPWPGFPVLVIRTPGRCRGKGCVQLGKSNQPWCGPGSSPHSKLWQGLFPSEHSGELVSAHRRACPQKAGAGRHRP